MVLGCLPAGVIATVIMTVNLRILFDFKEYSEKLKHVVNLVYTSCCRGTFSLKFGLKLVPQRIQMVNVDLKIIWVKPAAQYDSTQILITAVYMLMPKLSYLAERTIIMGLHLHFDPSAELFFREYNNVWSTFTHILIEILMPKLSSLSKRTILDGLH